MMLLRYVFTIVLTDWLYMLELIKDNIVLSTSFSTAIIIIPVILSANDHVINSFISGSQFHDLKLEPPATLHTNCKFWQTVSFQIHWNLFENWNIFKYLKMRWRDLRWRDCVKMQCQHISVKDCSCFPQTWALFPQENYPRWRERITVYGYVPLPE